MGSSECVGLIRVAAGALHTFWPRKAKGPRLLGLVIGLGPAVMPDLRRPHELSQLALVLPCITDCIHVGVDDEAWAPNQTSWIGVLALLFTSPVSSV